MTVFESRQWRRRTIGALLAILGCLSLVALPIVGLVRIDHATDRSHRYTDLVADVDLVSTNVLQLVTGPLAKYGTTHDEASRAAAVQGISDAEAILTRIEASNATARELGMEDEVNAQGARVRAVLQSSHTYLAEIDAGKSVADAPSTPAVTGAAGELLKGQGEFTLSLSPVSLQIDRDRRDALRQAKLLLGAAVGVALLTMAALAIVDGRLLQRRFASEAARRERAERLADHRADVVNMASHELRNPLTVLTLSTGVLKRSAEERSDAELGELADDAHTAALRCQALVDELLDLSRLDADRLQLKMGPSQISPAISDALAMSRAHHGVRRVVISGDPSVAVTADPGRLRIIVRNLIDNAFKYSPVGSTVHLTIAEWEGRVRLDVTDEGAGVPEGSRERIFQRFERLNSTAHLSGVGIGLYLSRELARRMNGELKCADNDHGASFLLELPLSA
jgi:signal transduction histidine kinase